MLSRLPDIFAPPVFEDQEKTRVAGFLNVILYGTLAVTLVVIFFQPLYSPEPLPRLLFISLFALLEIGGLLLIRRGRVALVVNLLPAAMWLLLTAVTYFSGGVRTTSFISYTIVIIIASLLGGGRVGIGYAAISTLAGLAFLFGEINGLLPPAVIPTTPVSIWVGLTANFLIAGLLLHLATRSITEALNRAHQNEADLQERNLQLRAQAQALKRREIALQKANRANQTRSECIQATVRMSNEEALLQAFCRILVEVGGYHLAWIGYAEQDDQKGIRPVAQIGFEDEFLDSEGLSWGENPLGRGPTGAAIRTGKPMIAQNILSDPDYESWRADAGKRGYAASIALPLATNQGVLGALNIYSTVSDSFDEDETRLLVEIADDLGHGIQALRTALALQENETRYRGIVEDQTEMIVRWQPDGIRTFVNESYCRYYGLPSEALVGTNFYPLVVEEDQQKIREKIAALTPGSPTAMDEHRSIKPSGETAWQQWIDRGIFDAAGNLSEIQSVGRDITDQKLAEEALQRSANRLNTLHTIDQAILAAESVEEIIDAALQNLQDLIPGQRFTATLLDTETKTIRIIGISKKLDPGPQDERRLPMDPSLLIDLMHKGEVYDIMKSAVADPAAGFPYMLEEAEYKSGYMTPIMSKATLIGTINMASEHPDAFSPEDLDIAQEVANSLGVALQTAGLVRSLQKYSAQLETLREASLQLTSDLALEPVLDCVLEFALKMTAGDDAHIFLYDAATLQLTFGAARWAGDPQEKPYAKLRPEGLTYTVARSGQRIVAPDVNSHPLFKDWPWGGAIIGLPLVQGGFVNGVMTVAFESPHNFPGDEIRILELLADQAAIAIHNAQLFTREHRQTQQFEALLWVGLALTADLELDSLLPFIVQQAIDLVGGTSGGLYLHDPAKDVLVWSVVFGDNLAPAGSTLRKGEGLSGLVWETGKLVNLPDYQQWEGKAANYKGFNWRSVVGVPVSRGGQFFGVLNILADSPEAFSEADADLLGIFAAQTAIAIENARLFQSVTEQSAQLRDLTAQLASLEEEERKRLSQELHDRVGQNLTALSINLNMAKSLLPAENSAEWELRLDESQRLVAETAQQIRDVMAELRPPVLDDYGLLAALRWYCERFSNRTGIEVSTEGQEITPRQALAVETALFRITQEALNNISRHADAQSVALSLRSTDSELQLTIADEGVGFDPMTPENNAGWGLRIMRERAESVEGNLTIESSPGGGTRILVRVPR